MQVEQLICIGGPLGGESLPLSSGAIGINLPVFRGRNACPKHGCAHYVRRGNKLIYQEPSPCK